MSHQIDLSNVSPPRTPNWCLVAPEGYCKQAQPSWVAPVYDASVETLWPRLLTAMAQEPRIRVHEQDQTRRYLDVTQSSLLFRFPDRITVQLLPAGKKASLAIYSRSKYGRSDLGVNAKRVKRLLAALER